MLYQNSKFKFLVSFQNGKQIICKADGYDINNDGSISFFQTGIAEDNKKYRVPVLSYAPGKWTECFLLDGKKAAAFESFSEPLSTEDNNHTHLYEDMGAHIEQKTSNDFHHKQQPSMLQHDSPHEQIEYRKLKEEWIEFNIKDYIKQRDIFLIEEFLLYLKYLNDYKIYKPQESEIIWICSKLIRSKQIMSKKFYNPPIQKSMSLVLPDIMKRLWDGKMSPILQVLQDKEETKNVTAIDLAVWMMQHNIL